MEFGQSRPLLQVTANSSKKSLTTITTKYFPLKNKSRFTKWHTLNLTVHACVLSFQCVYTQLVEAKRSFQTCFCFSLPSSPASPLALSGVPFSNRRDRKTSKCPHFAGDIWAFFCLCLLYIPVTLGTADRPPFLLRSSPLPLSLTAALSNTDEWERITSCVTHQNKTALKLPTHERHN